MKTLADLKRNATNYVWSLKENSWFKQVPQHQRDYRKVGRLLSNKLSFITNINGEQKESWIDFPKATEMQLTPINDDMYCLIIKRDCGDKPPHIMIYELKAIASI
jgi:hypothetical protein